MALTKLDIDRNINTLRVNSKEFSTIDNSKLISMLEESINNIRKLHIIGLQYQLKIKVYPIQC